MTIKQINNKFFIILIILSIFCTSKLFTQSPYPEIKNLQITDTIFKQYCDDVANARKAIATCATGKDLPIFFYRYKVKKEDSLLKIAARCSVPYDAIVSLNRIESAQVEIYGKELILPTLPAMYLPEDSKTAIEKLTEALFRKSKTDAIGMQIYEGKKKRKVFCFPNGAFDGTIRAFFFKPFYRYPLEEGIVTSGFGKRPSPFTGKPSYHPGIDLAAPTGSPVMACAGGTIKEIAYNRVYGKHIIIRHKDGRVSLYGHLSKVYAILNEKVKSGTIIGAVGSTGMSTGPHLHFEIRENGVPKNPAKYIETINN